MRRTLSIAAALSVVALWPAESGAARSPRAQAKSQVLTKRDVGPGFTVRERSFTPGQLAQEGTWTASQLKSWGYRGGYQRVFIRDEDGPRARQVASSAGVYRTAKGARQSLIANGNQCTVGSWELLPAPQKLGDQAVMCLRAGTHEGVEGELFFVVWRIGRVKASVSLTGPRGEVTSAQAIALARKQARRM